MNKIHTIKDIPAALYEGNPHETATTAWWKWREERTNRLSRQVIVSSSYPDGRPQGAQTNEGSLVPDFLPMLRKEGAVWFYLDEAIAALTAQPAPVAPDNGELERLRASVRTAMNRVDAAKDLLDASFDDLTGVLLEGKESKG